MPKITFHKHEIVGANKAFQMLKRLGFNNITCYEVKELIKDHMFRFDKDTKDSTYHKFRLNYGFDLIKLRLADRKGNINNLGKPLVTNEMNKDFEKIIRKNRSLRLSNPELKSFGVSFRQCEEIRKILCEKVADEVIKNEYNDLRLEVMKLLSRSTHDKSNSSNGSD